MRGTGTAVACICLLAGLGSLPARAFSIHDHVAVTEVAFAELISCGFLTGPETQDLVRDVISANVDEDLNLLRKWSRYSHYFHPYKRIDMRREDSSVTVEESQEEIFQLLKGRSGATNRSDIQGLLGRVIHHVQDASVPAHVAPVTHTSFTDGFEELEVGKTYFSRVGDTEHCRELAVLDIPRDLVDLLRANAISTLQSFAGKLEYSMSNRRASISWGQAFWIEDSGREFGSYGQFGNQFGNSSIRGIRVRPQDYLAYKAARLRSAVETSQAAVLWLTRNTRNR